MKNYSGPPIRFLNAFTKAARRFCQKATATHFGPVRATLAGIETPFGEGSVSINRGSYHDLPRTKRGLADWARKAVLRGSERAYFGNGFAEYKGQGLWEKSDHSGRIVATFQEVVYSMETSGQIVFNF